MTIEVEVSSETEARLAAEAAARSMDVPAYAATVLERSVFVSEDRAAKPVRQRPADRKSLAQLFAESPFRGLDLDFDRDPDPGRDIAL